MLPCAEEPQCGDPLQLWGAPGASGVRCRGDDRQVDDLVQSRCWAAVVAVAGSALSLISVCCDIYLSTPSDSATSCSEVDYVRAQRRQAQFGDHWTLLGLLLRCGSLLVFLQGAVLPERTLQPRFGKMAHDHRDSFQRALDSLMPR